MKKDFLSYLGMMLLLFVLIALFGSDISMLIGAIVFAAIGIGMPFGMSFVTALLCTFVFVLFSQDIFCGIILALSFIIPGWIMGFMVRKRNTLSSVLITGTITRAILLFFYYYRISLIERTTVKNLLMGEFPQELAKRFTEIGYTEDVIEVAKSTWVFLSQLTPAVILVSSMAFAFVTLAGAKFMMKRTPAIFAGMRKFSEIKMEASVSVFTVILIFFTFFAEGDLKIILMNVIYVLYVIYTSVGFAVFYKLIQKGVKIPVVSFLITGVIGFSTCGLVLPLTGLVSSFINTGVKTVNNENENLKG